MMPQTPTGPLLAVDSRALNVRHLRGIGRYAYEILASPKINQSLAVHMYGHRPDLPLRRPPDANFYQTKKAIRGQHLGTWEQLFFPLAARGDGAALMHSVASTAPIFQPVPTVVTVHDTKPWVTPRKGFDRFYWHTVVSQALHRCKKIITPSQSSKFDIAERWPKLSDRIVVIPHGLSAIYLEHSENSSPAGHATDPPFLLYVGGAAENKRFGWARAVFESIKSRHPEIRLKACGFSNPPQSGVDSGIDFTPFVPDEEMRDLYARAAAVLYTTEYEGFGFPVLEAHATGTPIILSPMGSLNDLRGPEANFVPLDDFDAWVEASERAIERKLNGRIDADACQQWARSFSWDKSAEKHLEIYLELADST